MKTRNNSRLTPIIDHGGVQEPRYYAYAYGYGKGGSSTWHFRCPVDNFFYVNLKYANFTGKTVKALVTLDGRQYPVELPPTSADPLRSADCFVTVLMSQPVPLKKGANHAMTFAVDEDSRDPYLEAPAAGGKLRAAFMLEAIILKAAYPPPYQGYGENSLMTEVK